IDMLELQRLRRLANARDSECIFAPRLRGPPGPKHVHAPKHRRRPNGRHRAGRSAGKYDKGRDHIPGVRWRFSRKQARIHGFDWTGKIDKGIEDMKSRARYPRSRRLVRIIAPAAGDARAVLVGKMSFDVENVAEHTLIHQPLELSHRREAALVI